jgi:hypothetical protein
MEDAETETECASAQARDDWRGVYGVKRDAPKEPAEEAADLVCEAAQRTRSGGADVSRKRT